MFTASFNYLYQFMDSFSFLVLAVAGLAVIFGMMGMTLRGNQREWYFACLERLFPDKNLKEQYMKTYGNQYQCPRPRAKKLWKLFSEECERCGILYNMKDMISAYKRNYEVTQLNMFDG